MSRQSVWSDAAHRYPTALLDAITAQLALVNANQPLATGGLGSSGDRRSQ